MTGRIPGRIPGRIQRLVKRTAVPLLAGLLVALPLLGAAPALAQNKDVKNLLDRVERLQRELDTLQHHVFRGEPPPATGTAPASELSGTQAARIEVRLSQFEAQLRTLTGQLEEQTNQIHQLTQKLDRMAVDFEARVQALEAGGAIGAAGDPAEGGATGAANQLATSTQQAAFQAAGPQEQYDRAFKLLSQTQYRDAARAFTAFLEEHPEHELAGNAKYWLGETYYVQGQYTEAAVTFAEGFQNYPGSSKAPDNLLKLGKSLAALGQNDDACGTFGELAKRYKSAAPTILKQAKSERQRLACP